MDVLSRLAVGRTDRLVHSERIPARAAQSIDWPEWLDAQIREAFIERGIEALGLTVQANKLVGFSGAAPGVTVTNGKLVDATTGLRFHPLEILFSTLLKIAAVMALGAPALAVIAFEIALNATSLFTHANIRLPDRTDSLLRRGIVTPAMHRIHHSLRREETDSNYGFTLSLWDRAFGTYRATPQDDPQTMPLGIGEFRTRREAWLDRLLTQPFRNR